jgi:hypothetical protein
MCLYVIKKIKVKEPITAYKVERVIYDETSN